MAVIQSGATTDLLTIDPQHLAGRASIRPVQCDGQFTWGASTGILPAALGGNSEVFQWRWSHASKLCLVTSVKVCASVTTTMFAAGVPVELDMIKSTGWSVAGTGGTGITFAALTRMRGSLANSSHTAGDVRIATTAALGAGTKTLETLSLANFVAGGPITGNLNGTIIAPGTILFEANPARGEYPLTLVTNEGFSIRSVAVPVTGTWRLSVIVKWMELTAY